MIEPLPAATVVVCRITTNWPHKILLQKRSEQAAFLPGAYVFPGGRVETHDEAFGCFLALDSLNATRIAAYFPPPSSIMPFIAAAIRETLEETGLSIVRMADSARLVNTTALNNIINGHQTSSPPLSLANLWPISWWITPLGETRRFDTRFFLAVIDDEEHLDHFCKPFADGITDYQWLYPDEALDAFNKKSMFLPPPARSILERMAQTNSLLDFLRFVDKPLQPIKPFFIDDEEKKKVLVLPGDVAHPEKQKPTMLIHTRYQFYER